MVPFITEYGAQAFPNLESLQKFAANPWPVPWDLLKKAHRCQPMFFAKWFNLSKFTTINELIEATQEYQAELLKFYNELWRINRYKPNGGALMFQFNDCFPGITWSIIDYWRTPKKGYFATQLSFEPVYVMADWPKKYYKPNHGFKTKIYVVNDLHALILDAKVRWEIVNQDKAVITSGDYKCRLEEDSIQTLGEIQFQFPPDSRGLYELILTLEFEETTIQNRYSLKIK
jgi:beta-mannosidase